jgi:multiple sugar transport system substrate-binding protein
VSPAYNDISLAVQRTLHPPASINPKSDVDTLRSQVDDAINSRGLL